jgi:predicted pyridoxine 5'-phosphate oxidase superfamily flavin-nucleotide-binding protein
MGISHVFLGACVHERCTIMTTHASPFHAGEQTIQSLAGVRDRMERKGRAVIRNYMPEQHRAFFSALPFMVVGLVDQNGHPWATALSGLPGFMNSTEPNLLTIKAWLDPDDPLHSCLRDGAPVGGLGIELSTRRRNRINGRIENCVVGEGFSMRVQQSFGNCPKYIQARNTRPRHCSGRRPECRTDSRLGDCEVSFIAEADTFFIASRSAQLDQENASQGLDVSHRGGRPGFVRVDSKTELCFPDYSGNLLFNTLGNLEVDARAGLLFIDFQSGRMLHIIGRARICWDVPETMRSAGVERLIFFDIERLVNRDYAFPHSFDFVSYSPQLGAEGQDSKIPNKKAANVSYEAPASTGGPQGPSSPTKQGDNDVKPNPP